MKSKALFNIRFGTLIQKHIMQLVFQPACKSHETEICVPFYKNLKWSDVKYSE